MLSKIYSYQFSSQSCKADVINLLINIDNHLSFANQIQIEEYEAKKNFHNMIDNLQKLMNYLHINQQWMPTCTPVENIKKSIRSLLIKGLLQEKYSNIIFVFHQHMPFTHSIEIIYKLLINSILDIKNERGIYINQVLSLYLTNAATYNNAHAIKILLEEYNVCPITIWYQFPIPHKHSALTKMPIIQVTNTQQFKDQKSFFNVYLQDQEHNFILMLSKINFADKAINTWQIQEIFKCAFKNSFFQAINYLLEQSSFCNRITITEEDIIMMAFSIITIPKYSNIIDIILKHPNILNNACLDLENIKTQINTYVNAFNNVTPFQVNYKILKIILDFTKTFINRRVERNFIYESLITTQDEIQKLQTENIRLLQTNQQLIMENQLIKKQLNKLHYNNGLLQLQLHYAYHSYSPLKLNSTPNAEQRKISSPTPYNTQRRYSYHL